MRADITERGADVHFVQVLDPQPPEGTAEVIDGGDGWIYAMPTLPGDALAWWQTDLVPYLDGGVWCLGERPPEARVRGEDVCLVVKAKRRRL